MIWLTHIMKTTLDIDDRLLDRAKREASARGTTLKAVVEDAPKAFRITFTAVREGGGSAVTGVQTLVERGDERWKSRLVSPGEFAELMVRDHTSVNNQATQLAKKLNVTPAPPSDDPVTPMAQNETNTLNSTAKGKDFDKAYVDAEVNVHKAVLDLATKAAGQTQTAELKNLIQKAAPVIKAHLDLAESIQKKLK